MDGCKSFLARKNIVISAKRYGIDALGAMAEGIHTMEEHVSVSSIGERLALAALTIVEVCRGFRP